MVLLALWCKPLNRASCIRTQFHTNTHVTPPPAATTMRRMPKDTATARGNRVCDAPHLLRLTRRPSSSSTSSSRRFIVPSTQRNRLVSG